MLRVRSSYDVAFYAPNVGALVDRNAVLPPHGGAETQILAVARALAGSGLRVCICTFDVPGGDLPREVDGVELVVRRPYARAGLVGRIREAASIIRTLAALGAAVYVTRTAEFSVGLVGIAARLRGRRFAFSSAHVFDFDYASVAPTRRDYLLYRLGVRLADRIVVQTAEQAELSRGRLGREALVVPNIVDVPPIRRRAPDSFLWVGRAVWYKQPLAYLDLARAVPEASFRAVCVAGIDDDLLRELQAAARAVPNLTLLDPMPREALLELMAGSVAIVNTSVAEGMPNVTLEGWALGVPTLTLAHDPDGLIAGRALGAFAAGSAEELARAAAAMWADRTDQSAVSARCRAYVRDAHSPEAVARAWRDALGLGDAVPAVASDPSFSSAGMA